jgi:hypothetical protein
VKALPTSPRKQGQLAYDPSLAGELLQPSAIRSDEPDVAFPIRERPPEHIADSWQLCSFVLDLIYSGHAELVEPFLEMVWPDDQTEAEEFLDYFLSTLSQSLYWPEIKDLSDEWPWPER